VAKAPRPRLGRGTSAALRLVDEVVASVDPAPDTVHREVRDRLAQAGWTG
jgi:hypothetical protein